MVRRLGATDSVPDGLDGGGFAQQALELGEDLLDGVQVGEYFGRKNSLAPRERMSAPHGLLLWLPRLSR